MLAAGIGQCERLGGDNHSAGPQMDRLETRRVVASKSGGHLLQFDARPGRIGIGMDDPHRSARYGRSNWLETLTATRSPGRAENRST